MNINESIESSKLRSGLFAGAATVGRPKGVEGKNRIPRRSKVTSKEVEHIKTKAMVKAGGAGSGRHAEYGKFEHKEGTTKYGGANVHVHTFESPKGTKVIQHRVYEQKENGDYHPSKIYENNKVIHEGSLSDSDKLMKSRYGLKP